MPSASRVSKVSFVKLATLSTSQPKQSGLFSPSPEQLRLKSKFWIKFLDDGGQPHDSIDLATVQKYVRHSKLTEWFTKSDEFANWFTEHSEYKQRAEYLGERSLDTLEELLINGDVPASARLGAIRTALEISGKLGKTQAASENTDEKIAGMSKEQVLEFIMKSVSRLPELKKLLTTEEEPK